MRRERKKLSRRNFLLFIQTINTMNSILRNNTTTLLLIFAFLTIASCSNINDINEISDITSDKSDAIMMPLAIDGIPAYYSEKQSEVSLFHFKNDDFSFSNIVKYPFADDLQVSVGSSSKIYCLSGMTLSAVAGVTKEHDFARNIVSFDGNSNAAPLFYSSVVDVNSVWCYGKVDVSLDRSVTRIDFTNFVDVPLYISEVKVLDAPASTFVFSSGEMPSDATVSLTKSFDSPFQGSEEGVFSIFESTRPVHLEINGEYSGAPISLEVTLPSVKRNKVYTVEITKVNAKPQAKFSVKDWEDVSKYAKATMTSGIDIDKNNSYLPTGVMVDYNLNLVNVPASGVSGMKIAFASSSKISIIEVVGNVNAAKISSSETVRSEDSVVFYLNVDIAPQANGAASYSVMVNVRNEAGNCDFVEFRVSSCRYIETVNIAGAEWMCFNAVSADLDNQVFPIDGMSVEEMYRNNWVKSIGNFFQFGKQKGYNPWSRNDPNGNNQTARNTPWTAAESIPVPEGYHVASSAEWLSLLPAGTTIPSSYTAGNGECIKAEIVSLPGYVSGTPCSKANKANLEMRYIRFESLETGNVLIIPICGQKTADTDEVPGSMWTMHDAVCYWTADENCECFRISADNNDQLKATQKIGRFDLDGFLPVRAIKNS